MDPRAQLQKHSDEYQNLQTELSNLVSARQKLESQQQENTSVQKEFATLNSSSAKIYKLVGPVLVQQDFSEAQSTVDGRLEFIGKEIKRIEESIAANNAKAEGVKVQIMQIQTQIQQQAPAAAA